MKKFLLPVLAAALATLSIWAIFRQSSGTINQELKDFAVKDTASIRQIFLADRAGNKILVKRLNAGEWMVNDSFPARKQTIKNLLEVIYRVDIQSRVSKKGTKQVLENLQISGIKCEIYLDDPDEPAKVYYVGGHTQDAAGTFMMIEGSDAPFVTEIPGFVGYLTPWYPTKLIDWRDKILFSYAPEEVLMAQVTYPSFPDRSFRLTSKNGKHTVQSVSTGKTVTEPDTVAIANYLALLRNVPFEDWNRLYSDAQKDSLLATSPVCIYEITNTKKEKASIRIHPMPINERSLVLEDSTGAPLQFDVDRMFALIEQTGELVVIQHFVFDPLFRRYTDFDAVVRKSTTAR